MNTASQLSASDVDTPRPRAFLRVAAALIVLSALAACAIVAWQLIVPGPFDWHISVDQTIQGGAEALLLIALLALAQWLASARWRNGLCLVLGLLYLRRHAVDLPLLVDLVYFEITIALGVMTTRVCGGARPQTSEDYLRCFVLGFVLWSVVAWTASACGFGSPIALRALTLILGLLALSARPKPLLMHLASRGMSLARPARALAAALVGWILVLFARTNVVAGYDSLWYGLRGEYMLAGDGSAYAPLGLVSPAHYVPKMFDVYLLPMSGLGDNSVIIGVTIGTLVLLGLAVARLMARLGIDDPMAKLCAAALCLTLPAVANVALESKPDIIAALFMLLAWMAGADWLRTRRFAALAWFMASAALATQAKLTAIPYAGLLFVSIACATWLMPRPRPAPAADGTFDSARIATVLLVLAALTVCFVSARTLILTGMPTIAPHQLFNIWTALGFELKPPAGTYAVWTLPQIWAEVPVLIVDWLFRPQRMEHIIITWVGNVWLWLPLIAQFGPRSLAGATSLERRHRVGGLALVAAGIILALIWRYLARGSDGNYFIVALIPAIVLATAFAWRRLSHDRLLMRATLSGILLIATFHASYAFVSAGWAPGTRTFDWQLTRAVRDAREMHRGLFAYMGMADVAEYLRVLPGTPRVIGCADYEASARLPARYEGLEMIYGVRSEFTADGPALLAYMREFRIPYLLLPRADADPPVDASVVFHTLCRPGWWAPGEANVVVSDKSYTLYYFPFK